MNSNDRSKGITLVSLVITIIILLILSGITINSLTGSGLFENTKLAKEKSENAQKLENETLGEYNNIIDQELYGSRYETQTQSGRTVLWDAETDTNGPIVNAGATDGSSERTFVGHNVNDYDAVIVTITLINTQNQEYIGTTVIDKDNFGEGKRITVYNAISSTVGNNHSQVCINNSENKIIYLYKGHAGFKLTKVVGIKY